MTGIGGQNKVEAKFVADIAGYIRDVERGAERTEKLGDQTDRAKKATKDLGATATRSASGVRAVEQAASRTSVSLGRASQNLENFGKKATVLTTLAAGAAIGVAKLGSDYEREFSKITGLVGIAADEVENMQSATLGLAGRTAQAPQQLAQAMFTLQSAGLRGDLAMSALEQSAQLAAGGMGEVRTIAQATTSILDQYAKKGVDAADAADFLAATARAGNFESSQLAGSLGKLLPISAQLNISLDDVGGSIALLTRGNGNASESITQVAAAMRVLMAPSVEATNILEQAGLTMSDVKETAAGPGGLVAALQQMYDATGQNDEQFARMLGSSEAVNAAFQILNATSQTQAETFGAVADRTGVAAEVFDAAAATSSFAWDQAMTQIKVAAIDVGSSVAPMLAELASNTAEFVGDAIEYWQGLPEPVQKAAGAVAVMVAGAGPAALALGKIGGAAQTAGKHLKFLSLGSTISNLAVWGPVGVLAVGAIAGIGKAWFDAAREQQAAAERAEILTDWLRQQGDATVVASDNFASLVDELIALRTASSNVVDSGEIGTLVEFADVWDKLEGGAAAANDALVAMGVSIDDVVDVTSDGTDVFERMQGGLRLVNQSVDALRRHLGDVEGPAGDFIDQMLASYEAGELTYEQLSLLVDALDEAADAYDDSRKNVEASNKAKAEELALHDKVFAAQLKATTETLRAAGVTDVYTEAMKTLTPELQSLIDTEERRLAQIERNVAAYGAADAGMHSAAAAASVATNAVSTSTDAFEDYADAVEDAAEELSPFERALMNVSAELRDQYNAAVDAANGVDNYRQIVDGIVGPQQRLDSAILATTEAFEALTGSSDVSISSLREAASAVRDQTFALAANGATAEEVAGHQAGFEQQLRNVAAQAGLTDAEIDQLISTYLSVPDEVVTQITATANAEQAASQLYGLTQAYWRADIAVALNEGDRLAVENQLNRLARDRATTISPTYGAADWGTITGGGTTGAGSSGGGGGGYVDPTNPNYVVNSSGDRTYVGPQIFNGSGTDITALYYHDGGVVGFGGPRHSGAPLRSDEVPAVLQTGERVLSRADNAWFERMFMQPNSTGAAAGPQITVAPGAVAVDASGSNLSPGDVQGMIDRGIGELTRQLTNQLRVMR